MGVDLEAGLHVEISSKEDDDHRHGALLEAIRALRRVQPIYRRLAASFSVTTSDIQFQVYGPTVLGGPPSGHIWLIQTVLFSFDGGGKFGQNFASVAGWGLNIGPTATGSNLAWGQATPNPPSFYSFSREDLLVRPLEKVWASWFNNAVPTLAGTAKIEMNVLQYPDVAPVP